MTEPGSSPGDSRRRHERPRQPGASIDVAATFADLHDRVIQNLHECALALTTILHDQSMASDPALDTLHATIDLLDGAIRDIRATAFAARQQLRPPSDARSRTTNHRYLVRIEDETVIAYIDGGHDFRRVHDDALWAHESDGLLLSSRSGTPIARRDGSLYYDTITKIALYYLTS